MKKLQRYFLIMIAMMIASPCLMAVTKDEMERARALAAQIYLRYANNGSDYLDALNPKSVAELEGKLKAKEKENIKAFKAVATPTDYETWDKDKLVKYWSETFFTNKGLSAENKAIRSSAVRKKISALSVSAPAPAPAVEPAPAPAVEPEKPVEEKPKEEVAVKQEEEIIPEMPQNAEPEAISEDMQQILDAEDQLEKVEPKKSSDSGTWIYVVILIALVLLVMWLVIFASKTMKKSDSQKAPQSFKDNSEELEEMESRFNSTLVAKNNDIRNLQRQNEAIADENKKLRSQYQQLKNKNSDLETKVAELSAALARMADNTDREEDAVVAAKRSRRGIKEGSGREIFVGRVNSKGIFLRADRDFNPANDVYRLVTTDGRTARFEIVDDDDLAEMIALSPQTMIGNGCKGINFSDVESGDRVVTIVPGEAIFDDGCWKVIKKAVVDIE